MAHRRLFFLALASALAVGAGSRPLQRLGGWPTHGGNARHTAESTVAAQPLGRIVWSTPVDLDPQYSGTILYAHYGSPLVSSGGILVLPVKTGANGGFRVEARNGATGDLLWQQDTDYVVPAHNWFPTFGPTIAGAVVAYPRKAGLVGLKPLDGSAPTAVCFYGQANYDTNPAGFEGVRISSPLVTAEDGSVVFTYRADGSNPLGLRGGIAVLRAEGGPVYVEGSRASGDESFTRPKLNCAPAVSGTTVYAVFKTAGGSEGKLVALNLKTLRTVATADLRDPRNGNYATVDDDGTACPTVGPDGDVFMGVLENPFGTHHYRGWLLHFDRKLAQAKTPGSFGWDDAPSVVPRALVPGYSGSSPYLILTKYNNYAGPGDGVNRMALLDPSDTQSDPYSDATVMKEVYTKVGPTPDAGIVGSYPNAVREWCVNTAAVDLPGHAALVNNEDGVLYRWNLDTNALDASVRLNEGIGQAYTSTIIGPNGMVYAISNARLYAIGQ